MLVTDFVKVVLKAIVDFQFAKHVSSKKMSGEVSFKKNSLLKINFINRALFIKDYCSNKSPVSSSVIS